MSILTSIETGAMLTIQVIDKYQSKESKMAAAWIRSVFTRSAGRHLAGVHFCGSCAQVCASACRARAQRRSAQLAPAPHALLR